MSLEAIKRWKESKDNSIDSLKKTIFHDKNNIYAEDNSIAAIAHNADDLLLGFFKKQGYKSIPDVFGQYSLPDETGSPDWFWQTKDFNIFEKLYYFTANNNNIGKGEFALYWLFKFQGFDTSFRSDNSGDIVVNDVTLELKSQSYINDFFSVGKWARSNQREKQLLTMLNYLFSIKCIYTDESIGEEQFNLYNSNEFGYWEVLYAIKAAKQLKKDITQFPNNKLKQNLSLQLDVISKFLKTNWSDSADTLAKRMSYIIIDDILKRKPGRNNFIVNVERKNPKNVYFFKNKLGTSYIYNKDVLDNIGEDSFKVYNGVVKVNLMKIFTEK